MTLTQVTTGGVDENISIDSNTLKVDGTNNRVGIGTTGPEQLLHVESSSSPTVYIKSNVAAAGSFSQLEFGTGGTNTSAKSRIKSHRMSTASAATNLAFETTNSSSTTSEIARFNSLGQMIIGGTAALDSDKQLTLTTTSTSGGLGILSPNNGRGDIFFGDAADDNVGQIKYSHVDNSLTIRTNASDRLKIDSSGRLLMGSSVAGNADADNINVAGAGNVGITFRGSSSGTGNIFFADNTSGDDLKRGQIVYDHSGNSMRLHTNAVERLRVDSLGRLLVNTSSARTNYNNTNAYGPILNLEGTSNSNRVLSFIHNDSSGGPFLALGSTGGSSAGSNTLVAAQSTLGFLSFQGADGTDLVEAAQIKAQVDGTPGNNDMPGRLVFSTTADGASSLTERMRITKDGHLLLGQSTTQVPGFGSTTVGCAFEALGSNGGAFFASRVDGPVYFGNRNNDGNLHECRRSGNFVGSISVNSSSTAFNTSSDHRLKENVVALSGAIDRVKQLLPKRFNFIIEPDATVDGFLAHEAQTVVPEAITGTHNEVDANNNPIYQGIDQSKLVPLLTAALQEAIAKIETLETKVAALEAAG